jgi:hypothetical protein
LTSDVDTSITATPQIKPVKQPHDADIDVLDLTPKSANTTQKDTAAATDATKNSITPTKEENKEKKKKKIRPKIKPIITPQESDNVEASSSDSNSATSSKDSGEEAQGREVSIRTELGFGEFAHSPPRSRSTSKKSLKSSGSQTGSNNDEDEAPKEGANYTEISKYWKSQSTKNKFKAPEKSDAAIRVGSVASSSGSTSGITATVTDDADVHVSQDVEETNAEKSPETTQGSEKEEVAAFTPEQPSTEADREEKDEEGGEGKAEGVGIAESTLGPSLQAKTKEEGGKQKATETLEQQSREEKTLEKINNTVAEVVEQSMTQDTDENSKTVVDETIVVEDKEVVAKRPEKVDSDSPQAKPEELENEETQKEEDDEEEDSQLIVPAASGSGSDSSGGDSNTNMSRSGSPSEDGYVKIVRNTLGVPMSESEFLSTPVVDTDKKETHEKTTADVEEEGQDGGKDNVAAATVTGQPQDVKEQEENEKVNEEKEGLEKKQEEQQVVDNADVSDVNPDGTTEASNQAANTEEKSSGADTAGGKTTPKKNNKKKKRRKGKKK